MTPLVAERCIAQVNEPPHYLHTHRCERKATTSVGSYDVCGVHARMARQWESEGRLDSMVASYWTKQR